MQTIAQARNLPVGAEVPPEGGVHFRVWAPRRKKVEAVLEGTSGRLDGRFRAVSLQDENNGYFSGFSEEAGTGTLYRFRLDGEDRLLPDPASRYQPTGPDGPSQVIDPSRFRWTDQAWPGVTIDGQVLYELHCGTFTREGTWQAAARELHALAQMGVTLLEIMPIADFAGRFGWSYDGVNLYAPTRLYGAPDDFRRFIDAAHSVGLGVMLDVVCNHLGPHGNYLAEFSSGYFSTRYKNEWGMALNFDGHDSTPVREFFIANAVYWISEFHIDGLRIDAAYTMCDESTPHILAEITRSARRAAGNRSIVVVAENEPQTITCVQDENEGGYGMDGLWNEDFHHSAVVALTGRAEAYFTDYLATPQEFISLAKWGFLYQGQFYSWQKKRRGTPAFGLKGAAFINYIQNHDQIANSLRGERLHKLSNRGRYKAITAFLLLGPGTPMLFQGQEFCASTPFLYFADLQLDPSGRLGFLRQFRSLATPEVQGHLANPRDIQTFERCKLDFSERERHADMYALHCDLLRLRREDPVFREQRADTLEGAVLGHDAFVLRFFGEAGDDRLLVVNLGRDLHFVPGPEPLLAPPLAGAPWALLWSSEHPRYGGSGTPALDADEGWRIPGNAAVVLEPRKRND
ncbi:MAG TPA: malto-oligosyltrehalose trehalohydrolase [Planctomycetota bacterium]|nr:malto-oligosyltrehalose trehalohydrolase [Planctomycetota bacterium]